ncbi:Store-Operated Calcium Entry Regulator Stimate [Manis pentadactyla]|nr:Store-Operated Calcium Entry Regulator Stimate [Manis pentadactyla]
MLMVAGECAIQFHDYSEAIVVSMVILEFQATGPRRYVRLCNRKGYGVYVDMAQFFGSYSDTLKLMATLGECAIQFHDYSEAIVVSMVILEFQATELYLELASDSDVRGAMARLSFMFTVTSMLTQRIQLRNLNRGKFEIEVQDYGEVPDASGYVE